MQGHVFVAGGWGGDAGVVDQMTQIAIVLLDPFRGSRDAGERGDVEGEEGDGAGEI